MAPGEPNLGVEEEFLGVPIIPDIQSIKRSHAETALSWRQVTGDIFSHYFESGYSLIDVLSPEECDEMFFCYILQRRK